MKYNHWDIWVSSAKKTNKKTQKQTKHVWLPDSSTVPCPLGEAKASWSKVITWPPAFRILRRTPSVTLRAQICGTTKEHEDYVRKWQLNYIFLGEKKLIGEFLPWAWGCPESWHHQWLFPQQQRFCSHGQASSSYGSDCNGNKVSNSACIFTNLNNWQQGSTDKGHTPLTSSLVLLF